MKKVLALVLAAIFVASNVSFAQEFSFKNFKLYGEGSIYGFTYENSGVAGVNMGGTSGYITLGAMFDVYENITASFALGYQNLWGDDAAMAFSGRPINSSNTDDGYLNKITVVEANLNFNKLFDVEGLSAKVGRQYYGDEDSSMMYFGIRRDQPLFMVNGAMGIGLLGALSSLDAFAGYYAKENMKINAVYGIMQNGGINGNATIIGADLKYAKIADMIDVQAYGYDVENWIGTRNYTILGLKPTVNVGTLKASVEFAKNFGGDYTFSNDNFNTNFIKADASFKIEDIGLTPRAAYVVAGGENKPFITFGNYLPGLIVGQTLLAAGWMDNQIINIGADYVKNKFLFSLDFFNYGSRDGGDFEDAVKYGSELDLIVKYNYTQNVDFRVGIGHLFGNKDSGMDFDASTLQAGVTYKFK